MFLSKAELDYLTAKQQFNDGYVRVIESRLQKKLKIFVNQELPLLLSKGYRNDIAEFRDIAENCKTQRDSLVRIPLKTGDKQVSPDAIAAKTVA